MPWITSANIACGAHAGDDRTIRTTLRLCRTHGIDAGAHPGFDDREHFGRRELSLSRDDLVASLSAQLRRIDAIAREEGVLLKHVKPHGALYNLAARDRDIADIIAEVVQAFDPLCLLVGLSGSASIAAAEARRLRVAHEVYAERGYGDDGRLLPRGTPGAVLETLDEAIAQARGLALRGRVRTASGAELSLRADTLCLHGDRDDAAAFARALREALQAEHIDVLAPEAR